MTDCDCAGCFLYNPSHAMVCATNMLALTVAVVVAVLGTGLMLTLQRCHTLLNICARASVPQTCRLCWRCLMRVHPPNLTIDVPAFNACSLCRQWVIHNSLLFRMKATSLPPIDAREMPRETSLQNKLWNCVCVCRACACAQHAFIMFI